MHRQVFRQLREHETIVQLQTTAVFFLFVTRPHREASYIAIYRSFSFSFLLFPPSIPLHFPTPDPSPKTPLSFSTFVYTCNHLRKARSPSLLPHLRGEALLPLTYFDTFTAARDECARTCETEWGGKRCTSFSIANVRNSGTNFSCVLFSESPGNDLFWVSPVRVNNVHNTANVTSFVKKNSVQQLSAAGTCPAAATLYPFF